ncbi:aminoacyl-tRNA hydrolase [Globicatella sanguinis]|uniref:aminoacyl-tRNA hydrolase n=1 Tax=Globicatella sanguinis TaxID=13076 RepID=UPI000C7CAA76|nr:aminoacyl-tRNA hydrolase [Globicatella sanguinis]MDK7630356.1 aminoacyl-tRNA hydrolase [Globicatella sanguinis]WIK67362.1 aminoacyl-tRNA hydrolase [Globicatella sanguinis]WKT56767.1 aminoacyl-tRNA hydrolase [Globicatella sanguinis]
MKLIIGLGNPGNKYDGTRHNIGFDVVDRFLDKHSLSMTDQKFRADYTSWHHNGERIYFMKPYTYMNLSGEAVLPLMSYFGIGMEDILVIYDDLDLEPGRIRLRRNGSSGGHNGMKSIIEMLGSQEFNRIKVGIGRPSGGWKVVDHVLAPFSPEDRVTIDATIDRVVEAIEHWIEHDDFSATMNIYNQK